MKARAISASGAGWYADATVLVGTPRSARLRSRPAFGQAQRLFLAIQRSISPLVSTLRVVRSLEAAPVIPHPNPPDRAARRCAGPPTGERRRESATGAPLSVVITRKHGTVVVTLHGALGVDGTEQLRWVLEDLMENQGNLTVVVDLSGTTTVGTSAMDTLEDLAHRASQRGGELTVTGARPANNWKPADAGWPRGDRRIRT